MGQEDGRHVGSKAAPRTIRAQSLTTKYFAAGARRYIALATAAVLLAVIVWTTLGAGHAQARRLGAAGTGAAPFFVPKLTPLPAEGVSSGALLGFSVALSADGKTAIVGAPDAGGAGVGAAWVFTLSGSTWTQQATLTAEVSGSPCGEEAPSEAEQCGFGRSVSLSSNGNVALIGSPRNKEHAGAAWVFTRSGTTWTRGQKLTGGEEVGAAHFGRTVALSADASTAVVGGALDAAGRGAVWVFARSGEELKQQEKLTAPSEVGESFFGGSVALSHDGNEAIVGAPGDNSAVGAAWVFTRSGEAWTAASEALRGGVEESGAGRFGSSVALSAEGRTALVGARTDNGLAGAAWAFTNAAGGWEQVGRKLTGGTEQTETGAFGYAVALNSSGEEALIGAPADASGVGAAWLFKLAGSHYARLGTIIAGSKAPSIERFGTSVALSQTGAEGLLGAPRSNIKTGAAIALSGIAVPGPTVTGITPAVGPATGGTRVTIEGSGFLQGATVTIGGEATGVEVISETKLSATTSAAAAGAREVVVSDENGTSVGGPSFTFKPPPTITGIAPPTGSPTGGTLVTLEGSGFLLGAKVTIGSEATGVEVISESKLTARTAATAPGPDEVVVSDEYGTSTGGPLFTYATAPAPPLTEVKLPMNEVLSSTTTTLPPPKLGVNGDIEPASGLVFVRLPGSTKFVPLTGLQQVPFGTIVDARRGNVMVTTTGPHGLQSMNFYEGEFQLAQASNGLASAVLYGSRFSSCPTARERAHIAHTSSHHSSRHHVVRKLWASGHGSYSTKGNYATGAVLGTVWLTEDRCDGTLFKVVKDAVSVTNLVNHRHVLVKAPKSYLAKAR
jgi:IPT/TIG domain/FG-GAP repeat